MKGTRAAVSLYVAVAVHLLLILLLALGPLPQLPGGIGLGIDEGDGAGPSVPVAAPPPAAPRFQPRAESMVTPLGLAPAPLGFAPASPEASKPVQRPAAAPRLHEPSAAATRQPKAAAAAVSDAPMQGPAQAARRGGAGGGQGGYFASVRRHLARHRSRLVGIDGSGRSQVVFTVQPDGQVSGVRLYESSGIAALDTDAVALITRAAPLPAPPDGRARRLIVPLEIERGRPLP